MKSVHRPLHRPFSASLTASVHSFIVAGLLATAGASVMAQGAPMAPPAGPAAAGQPAAPRGEHMGRHDPAKMQAWIVKRQAELKVQLKLTPAQEGAWTAYTAAMQPPAHGARPTPEQHAELDKLTTPERIDKMRAVRTQRMSEMAAAMDQRDAATKTFYAALTPEQQKTFDAAYRKHGPRGGHEGRGGPGHHGGPAPQKG